MQLGVFSVPVISLVKRSALIEEIVIIVYFSSTWLIALLLHLVRPTSGVL